MTITFNGQIVEAGAQSGLGLQTFLEDRGLKIDRIAVEYNGEIVPRSRWQEVTLKVGDRLEVVHFVGGGCR